LVNSFGEFQVPIGDGMTICRKRWPIFE